MFLCGEKFPCTGLDPPHEILTHENGLYSSPNSLTISIDRQNLIACNQCLDGDQAVGRGDPRSGWEASTSFVMDCNAASEEGVGIIGLKVIDLNFLMDFLL